MLGTLPVLGFMGLDTTETVILVGVVLSAGLLVILGGEITVVAEGTGFFLIGLLLEWPRGYWTVVVVVEEVMKLLWRKVDGDCFSWMGAPTGPDEVKGREKRCRWG